LTYEIINAILSFVTIYVRWGSGCFCCFTVSQIPQKQQKHPDPHLVEFDKGEVMSLKGRIFFILSGCLFLAGAVFPWAWVGIGSTVESFKGDNLTSTLLYLTGGAMLVASFVNSGKLTKIISALASVFGLGWGIFSVFYLVGYFTNPPRPVQSSDYVTLGSGLFLILCASILLIGYGEAAKIRP
jgi:hypothetical protein